MMIKICNLIFCLLVFFYSAEIIADNLNCPSFDNYSAMTQNMDGNSAYEEPGLRIYFNSLIKIRKLNLKDPILDVGAGYGSATFELIKLGAKNVYVNDLDKRNLACMQSNIDRVYPNNNFNLVYLPGDIVSNQVLSKLPNQFFSLIYTSNVIHFFTYDQLIKFIKALNQKTKKDGIVTITFENPYINELNYIVKIIFDFHKKFPQYSLEEVTENIYQKIDFPGQRHCSVDTYKHVLSGMKLPGFPCELPVGSGVGQLLLPDIMISLMRAAGFDNIVRKFHPDKENRQLLVFIKNTHMSENQINKNIELSFKEKIKTIENGKEK